ncbi:MAG: type II CRISPR RNA-guided endonuclease Cas9 [Bacteroidales bacterium]|nr:type II CRISPR RNA-guided endonuclease Cas9 [Bacteroidales bacterium]
MKRIFGLDLGTNSIGWAVVNEAEDNSEKSNIVKAGARIIQYDNFSKSDTGAECKDPVADFTSGKGISANAARTKARGMRRRLQRYKSRRHKLTQILKSQGWINDQTLLCEEGKGTTLETLSLRSRAASEEISLEELARVLLTLNKKRGYRSSRKESTSECEENSNSDYLTGIANRSAALQEVGLTIGQWKLQHFLSSPHSGLKNSVFYRQDYKDEFEKIWEVQSQYHPELTEELKEEIRDGIIFFQRDLKSQKSRINFCPFESRAEEVTDAKTGKKIKCTLGCRVAPKSSPLFQEFRIWQTLNNVVVTSFDKGEERFLTQEEKELLYDELSYKDKLTKTQVFALLKLKKNNHNLNFEELPGNRAMHRIVMACKKILEQSGQKYDFSKSSSEGILATIEAPFRAKGVDTRILHFDSSLPGKELESQSAFRFWHLIYSYVSDESREGNEKLIDKLESSFGIPKEWGKVFANIAFEPDYCGLSAKAMRQILPFMEEGMRYDEACKAAGYNHSSSLTKEENEARELKNKVDLLPQNTLRNPVVEKILNQMANVVNLLIETYGRPDEIRIELARELKKTAKQRQQMTKAINDTAKRHEKIREILEKDFHILHPTRNDILRYKLYEELASNGYKTLYSNKEITRESLFSKDIDIEHIVPKAKLFDDSFANKTLEYRDVNLEKRDMTAMDYVEQFQDTDRYKSVVENLYKNGRISKAKHNLLLMHDSEIPTDFLNRDLAESQYIARQAREMLFEIVRTVTATTGSITKRLREDWGLVDIMQELAWDKYDRLGLTSSYTNKDGRVIKEITGWTKRNDHRHHAMDALTIAFTKPSYIQLLNNLAARSDKNSSIYGIQQKEMEFFNGRLCFIPPMERGLFRREAKRCLSEILVSMKPKGKVATHSINRKGQHPQTTWAPRGSLHNDTIYGSILVPKVELVKVDGKMDAGRISHVTNSYFRKALAERLAAFGGDSKKAFTGKNSPAKNPIYTDAEQTRVVPEKVKIVTMQEQFTIRKDIGPDLKIDKVIDKGIRELLVKRLHEYQDDPKLAFANLDANPIWLNRDKGIAVKSVIITGVENATPLHEKRDHKGHSILDDEGNPIQCDYVSLSNNNHVAIFEDAQGNLQEQVVSLFEATSRLNQGLPVIDKEYNKDLGWRFLFSMRKNEFFVFPDPETGFDPAEIDLMDESNAGLIALHLYRVQKLTSKDYYFRHHLEAILIDDPSLKGTVWKRIKSTEPLRGIIKVRINHIGQIVHVGE